MSLTTIRLPDHLIRELDEAAERRKTTRSELIREAVTAYCVGARSDDDSDPVALVERLVRYDGSRRGDLGRRSEEHLRERFRARTARAR